MVDHAERFAVVVFDRVFDTTPKQEVIALDTLIAGLLRFEVKREVHRNQRREVRRIHDNYDKWRTGEDWAGRIWRRLRTAEHAARANGEDINLAVKAKVDRLLKDAKGLAKKELRIWSPALYQEGKRRESQYVQHLSCLVLDYDEGMPIEWATDAWSDHLHVVHTTFSHTTETPKFRIALPLAHPVLAEDWPVFWSWAQHRSGMAIDPAPCAPSSTFALPATPDEGALRIAQVNPGRLLDPLNDSPITRTDVVPPLRVTNPHSHFHGGAPDHTYIEVPRSLDPLDDPDALEDAFEDMF
jgi:hypothetical protein